MRQLIDILLQNQVLLLILLFWLGSAVFGGLARAARRAQQQRQRERGLQPGEPAPPAQRPSTEEIAAEIRRMMEGGTARTEVERDVARPALPPAAAPVDVELAAERERRRRALLEERQRKVAERRHGQEARAPQARSATLEEELAAKEQRRREQDRERTRQAEANRSQLGTLGGTAAAHEPSRKSALHELEGRLAKARRPRAARRARVGRLVDVHEPAKLFLAGELFGAPRALRDLEQR
jgi:hypothetical protein